MRWTLLALLGIACGGPGSESCPNDLPSSCPAPAPSYSQNVAPIVASRCLACHARGGLAGSVPLDSGEALASRKTLVLHEVYACLMPPPGVEAPSADERQTLLSWLVCGAPVD